MTREQELGKEISSSYQKLCSERTNFDSLYQDIGDYILPRKSNIITKRSAGEKQMDFIYDSTAIHALELLAASLNSSLTSQSIRWFSLKPRNKRLQENQDAMKWMEDAANEIYFEYQVSNFGSEFHEAYLDIGGFGTNAVLQEEGKDRLGRFRLIFKAIDISEYKIQENEYGLPDEFFHKILYKPKQFISKFGEANIPVAIRTKIEKDPYGPEIECVHVVRRRTSLDTKNELMPYSSVFVLLEGNVVLSEGGYQEFPYAVARWAKTSGEIYGRSPSMKALPDVRTLNKAKELDLKAWAKEIDPPLFVEDDGVIGQLRTSAGGITYVRNKESVTTFPLGAGYQATQIRAQELRQSIRECYFADQLQLPPFQGTPATATEIQERVEQMNRLLGPTVGRLGTEMLEPTIMRSFFIMLRAGRFEPPPEELANEILNGDKPIEIEYLGPLARTQKMSDVMAIQRWIGTVAPLVNIRPEVADVVDTDSIAKITRERLGVPTEAMRPDKAIKRIREDRATAMAQQNAMNAQAQQAQNARDMAPLIKASQGGQGAL